MRVLNYTNSLLRIRALLKSKIEGWTLNLVYQVGFTQYDQFVRGPKKSVYLLDSKNSVPQYFQEGLVLDMLQDVSRCMVLFQEIPSRFPIP